MFLLLSKLPEGYCAGGGNVERVNAVVHWDFYGIVAGGDRGLGKSGALGAENDSELFLLHKARIVDRDRVIRECHGAGLEAE